MQDEILGVIMTDPETLEPCPMCGGSVRVQSVGGDWGRFDLRHAKFLCEKCGGIFEYAWASSAHKRMPWAIEWWNTRTPAQEKTCGGYSVEQLLAIAALLKENDITPSKLTEICNNLSRAVEIAQRIFVRDLNKQLQARLAQMPGLGEMEEKKLAPAPWLWELDDDRETCGLLEED